MQGDGSDNLRYLCSGNVYNKQTKIFELNIERQISYREKQFTEEKVQPDKMADLSRTSKCQKFYNLLKTRLLAILTILSIILGFGIGFGIRPFRLSDNSLMWLGFPGEIFLSLLKMPIIPLIISSMISATGNMDLKKNGKLGLIMMTLHIASNTLCSGFGVILGVTIKPGVGIANDTIASYGQQTVKLETQDIAADMIRNLFPDNLVRATFQKKMTKYDWITETINKGNATEVIHRTLKQVAYVDSMNVIGLIVGCTLFGLAAAKSGEKGKAMLQFFHSATHVIVLILGWLLWVAPIGIFSLIAASVAAIEDVYAMSIKLGLFVCAVLLGLFVHQMVVLPVVYIIATRRNPFKVYLANLKGWCVGFAAASSAATMPYMFVACKKMKVDDRVAAFGIPLAVTINAAGSSIFICCSVVFLAQLSNITLTVTQLLTLFVLTSTSSLALPAAPSSSIVLIVIFCTTLSVPVESIGLLFAVEWLLDRLRTACNVSTEMFIIVTTWHRIKKDFQDVNVPSGDDIKKEFSSVVEKALLDEQSNNNTML